MRKISAYLLNRENIIQIAKFVIVGFACVAVEFGVYSFLIEFYGLNYLYANMFSLAVSLVLNYVLLRAFVFTGGRFSGKVEFTAFIAVSLIGILMNQSLLWAYVEIFSFNNKIGKILAIGSVVIFNFITKKFIVFKN